MADQYRMSAVILCGGKSRRMGTDKAMLTAEGKPNAVRLLHALSGEDSPCTEVWLSIGTGESYPAIHAQKVSDRFPGCGPMGGLEAALTVCREEYLFVAPVDTPFADAQMARELMTYMADASRQRDAVLVVDGDGRQAPDTSGDLSQEGSALTYTEACGRPEGEAADARFSA